MRIGIGASIKEDLKIEENVIIGANSFVNKDCKKNQKYLGSPAKIHKKKKKIKFMTYIIAEIGVNHNNNLNYSKKIIDFCVKEKVDAVKFQTYTANNLALRNTPKVLYQKKNKNDKENHFDMLKKLELSKDDHIILKNYCDKKIEFISPYDIESAKFLIKLKLSKIKVASKI